MARTAKEPTLEPGRIYRTRELARFGTNLARLMRRLVREGKLVRLAYGFYLCPDGRPPAERHLGPGVKRSGDPLGSGSRTGSRAARAVS
jgi:hypothetical protein